MSSLDPVLIKELLKDYKSPEDLIGKDGLLKQLTKALLEKALDSELTEHLGYEKNALSGKTTSNSRRVAYPVYGWVSYTILNSKV